MKKICIVHAIVSILLILVGYQMMEWSDYLFSMATKEDEDSLNNPEKVFGFFAMISAATGFAVSLVSLDKNKNGNMLVAISSMLQLGSAGMFLLFGWAMLKQNYSSVEASIFWWQFYAILSVVVSIIIYNNGKLPTRRQKSRTDVLDDPNSIVNTEETD